MRATFQGNAIDNGRERRSCDPDIRVKCARNDFAVPQPRSVHSGPQKKTSHPAGGGRASWEGKLRPTEATLARALGGTLADLLGRTGPRLETRRPDRTEFFGYYRAPRRRGLRDAGVPIHYGTTELPNFVTAEPNY